ncbi:MAG: hypothetical protein L3K15_01050 [Thermoplasmata archaeon]|nr:hypothetical protein [Thermoplasmata archaeon]
MPGLGPGVPEWISPRMTRGPCNIWIWGDARLAVNRAAFEVVHRVQARYAWIDIGSSGDDVDPEDPSRNGLVPDTMLYRTIPPADLEPSHALANLAMWSVVRADEPIEVLHPLMDFLRLPQLLQEIIGNAPSEGHPAVFVVANADRLIAFYPDDDASSQPILDVWKRERLTAVVTLLDHPRKDRFLYDYVFEVRSKDSASWRDARILCEKAPADQGFRMGVPLRAFPG